MRNKYLALLLSALFCFQPAYGVAAKKKAKSTSKTSSSKAAPSRKAAPKKGTATAVRSKGRRTTTTSSSTASRRRTTQRTQATPTPERYKEIQQALAEKGFYKGEVNGQWGPESVEALKKFQEEQKLQVDGKIGALSLIALGLGPKRQASPEAVVTMPQKTNP